MKKSVVLFFFIVSVFSSVTVTSSDRETFYTNARSFCDYKESYDDYYVTTDMSFTNTMTVRTTATVLDDGGGSSSDLGSGAVICPGNITITNRVEGVFADDYWYAGTYITPSADEESDYYDRSTLTHDIDIRWDGDDYETLLNIGGDIQRTSDSWDDAVVNAEQRIDFYEPVVGTFFYNKEGSVGMTCKARIGYRTDSSSYCHYLPSYDYVDVQSETTSIFIGGVYHPDYGGSSSYTLTFSTEGTRTINSRLVTDGCAAIIQSELRESSMEEKYIYPTMSVCGDEYSHTQSAASFSLTVDDREMGFDVDVVEANLTVGERGNVTFDITNTGDVEIRITSISSSDVGISSPVSGTITIDAGESRTIEREITVPSSFDCENETISIVFGAEADEAVCAETSESVSLTLTCEGEEVGEEVPPAGEEEEGEEEEGEEGVEGAACIDFI